MVVQKRESVKENMQLKRGLSSAETGRKDCQNFTISCLQWIKYFIQEQITTDEPENDTCVL